MSYSEPIIQQAKELLLIGQSIEMSFAENKTFQLWSTLMPRRNEIQNRVGNEIYSLEIFPDRYFYQTFDPHRTFQKWGAFPVSDFENVPAGMKTLVVPAGNYAVFTFKGTNDMAEPFYRKIITEWFPASAYEIDDRPHFAVMGNKYKKNDPTSEEEIWFPVRIK